MKKRVIPIVMSGGKGSRLEPLSSPKLPKQFINFSDYSMFMHTMERLKYNDIYEHPVISSNISYISHILDQLTKINVHSSMLVLEPKLKNTGPAALFTLLSILPNYSGDSIVAFMPSDHYMDNAQLLNKLVQSAADYIDMLAKEGEKKIALLGIKPLWNDINYGHILCTGISDKKEDKAWENDNHGSIFKASGANLENEGKINFAISASNMNIQKRDIQEFVEKPSLNYINNQISTEKDNLFWNTGIYIGHITTFLQHFKRYANDMLNEFAHLTKENNYKSTFRLTRADGTKIPTIFGESTIFDNIKEISIDRCIIGQSKDLVMFYASHLRWLDLGSFDNLKSWLEIGNRRFGKRSVVGAMN